MSTVLCHNFYRAQRSSRGSSVGGWVGLVFLQAQIYTSIYVYIRISVCICMCVYTHVCTHIHREHQLWGLQCVYVYIHIHIYIYICLYTYIHTHVCLFIYAFRYSECACFTLFGALEYLYSNYSGVFGAPKYDPPCPPNPRLGRRQPGAAPNRHDAGPCVGRSWCTLGQSSMCTIYYTLYRK